MDPLRDRSARAGATTELQLSTPPRPACGRLRRAIRRPIADTPLLRLLVTSTDGPRTPRNQERTEPRKRGSCIPPPCKAGASLTLIESAASGRQGRPLYLQQPGTRRVPGEPVPRLTWRTMRRCPACRRKRPRNCRLSSYVPPPLGRLTEGAGWHHKSEAASIWASSATAMVTKTPGPRDPPGPDATYVVILEREPDTRGCRNHVCRILRDRSRRRVPESVS